MIYSRVMGNRDKGWIAVVEAFDDGSGLIATAFFDGVVHPDVWAAEMRAAASNYTTSIFFREIRSTYSSAPMTGPESAMEWVRIVISWINSADELTLGQATDADDWAKRADNYYRFVKGML